MPSPADMTRVVAGLKTKSDKIRALTKAGFNRKAIAGFLNIRYQHVRNVQVDAGLDGFREEGTAYQYEPDNSLERFVVTLDSSGRIVIPAAVRKAMEADEGSELFGRVVEGELRLATAPMTIKRLQELVARTVPPGVSLADSLIEDRRREAERENDDD
jgi:AbrB family looped-hinge helix DNA binding protein